MYKSKGKFSVFFFTFLRVFWTAMSGISGKSEPRWQLSKFTCTYIVLFILSFRWQKNNNLLSYRYEDLPSVHLYCLTCRPTIKRHFVNVQQASYPRTYLILIIIYCLLQGGSSKMPARKKKDEDEDTGPTLIMNKGKDRRIKDERDLKVHLPNKWLDIYVCLSVV